MVNSTFSENHAESGGGILAYDKAKLTVQDSFFVQNEAARVGGAVFLGNVQLLKCMAVLTMEIMRSLVEHWPVMAASL